MGEVNPPEPSPWSNAVEMAKRWVTQYAPNFNPSILLKTITDMAMKDGITQADAGKLNDVVKTALKETAVSLNPSIASAPKNGQKFVDKYGNVVKIYPDGTVEELEDESSLWGDEDA
jgi:hypothetical protein